MPARIFGKDIHSDQVTRRHLKKDAVLPEKLIYVFSESDFPESEGGVIPLENGTQYKLGDNVTITKSLKIPDSGSVFFTSIQVVNNVLSYTGTGSMFTGDNINSLLCELLILSSPNGSIFNLDGPSTGFISLKDCIITNSSSVGTVDTISYFQVTCLWNDLGDGGTFTDTEFFVLSTTTFSSFKNSANTIMVDLQGDNNLIQINDCFFEPQSNEIAFNFDSSSTTNGASIIGNVVSLSEGGSIFASTSFDQKNIFYQFLGNTNIEDSTVRARLKIDGNSLVTTISAANIPTKINTTWTNGGLEERIAFQIGCSFDGSTDIITSDITHGLSDDDEITFKLENSGTLPANLSEGVTYYVIVVTATTFQVSATAGGAAIDFTGNGTADQYYRAITGNNDGVVVYTGLEDVSILISGWASMRKESGTTRDMRTNIMNRDINGNFTLCCNGGLVSPSSSRTIASPINNIIKLSTNQGLAIYVENLENNNNIVVSDLLVSVSKV